MCSILYKSPFPLLFRVFHICIKRFKSPVVHLRRSLVKKLKASLITYPSRTGEWSLRCMYPKETRKQSFSFKWHVVLKEVREQVGWEDASAYRTQYHCHQAKRDLSKRCSLRCCFCSSPPTSPCRPTPTPPRSSGSRQPPLGGPPRGSVELVRWGSAGQLKRCIVSCGLCLHLGQLLSGWSEILEV